MQKCLNHSRAPILLNIIYKARVVYFNSGIKCQSILVFDRHWLSLAYVRTPGLFHFSRLGEENNCIYNPYVNIYTIK